jgi:hypothetical protein
MKGGGMDLIVPSDHVVDEYVQRFNDIERYRVAEKILDQLFSDDFSNNEIHIVFRKVSLLNSMASTNIYATFALSQHILSIKDFDERLHKNKDVVLVRELSHITINGKHKNFYSFASKYCSYHDHESYPMFDGFVERILILYRDNYAFGQFRNIDLRDYKAFKEILNTFRSYFELEKSFREIDNFLWLYGKEIKKVSS